MIVSPCLGRSWRLPRLALAALVAGVLAVAPVRAATLSWGTSGTGGTGTWDTTNAGWWNGTSNIAWVNANNDIAYFGGTAGTVTLGTGITTNGMIFAATGYTATGNTLTLAGAAPTITTNTGVTGTVGSILAGSVGLTTNGTGTLTLTAANTYTGTTTISAGTLQVGNGGTTGSLASAAVVNNANLVYNFSTTGSFALPSGSITGSGNLSGTARTIMLNGSLTQGGAISLVEVGAAATLYYGMSLSGANTITGSSITITADIGSRNANGNSLALDTSTANGPMSLNFSLGRTNVFYYPNSFTANSGTGTISVVGSGPASSGWTVNTSGTVALTGRMNITANVSSNATVVLNETTATGTVSGILSNGIAAMSLVKGGAGTLTLTAANTYTGTTTISQGTLRVGNGGTTGSLASAAVVNNANLVYSYSTTGSVALPSGSITGSGNLSGTARRITLNGGVTQGGTISLAQVGTAGTLYDGIGLTGANTITGSSITITADIGSLGANGNSLALDTSGANGPMSLNFSLGRGGVFYYPNSFTANSGTGTISVVGSGPASSGWTVNTSGTVALTGRMNITANVSSNATVVLNETTATGTVSGILSNGIAEMSLVKGGAGTLTLAAANSYTGVTTIRAGTLVAGANAPSAANGIFGNATSGIVLGAGTTGASDAPGVLIGGTYTVGRAISVGSVSNSNAYTPVLGGANTSGTATFSGAVTLNTTASAYTGLVLQAAPGGTVDFAGAWTTNNKPVTVGSAGNTGSVRISSALPTTGGVTVSAGTLLVGSTSALGSTTPVTVAAAGTLDVANFAATIGTLSGGGAITGTTGGVLTVTQAANATYSGALVGGVGLRKTGTGTLTLTGSSGYTGATTVSEGTLAIAGASSIASSPGLGIASGATLDIAGASGVVNVGALTGAGNVTLGGNTLRTTNGGENPFGGVVSGAGGFTKAGAVTLTLTGSQAFTGEARVEEGTLVLSNGNAFASASRIFVAAGATLDTPSLTIVDSQTLGGYGTVFGGVTLNPGAVVSPGGSIGNLTVDGGVTFSGTSGYKFEITNAVTGTTPGTDWDLLTATSLTITSTPEDPFRILLTSLTSGTDQTPGSMGDNWDPNTSYQWLFATTQNQISSFDANSFTINTTTDFAPYNTLNGLFSVVGGASIGKSDTDLYIVYIAVPEPGAFALAGIGLAAAVLASRRR